MISTVSKLAVFASLAALAEAAPLSSLSSVTPTSRGTAIIGFEGSIPDASEDSFMGFSVKKQFSAISAIVVEAADLSALASALEGVAGIRYIEDDATVTALAPPSDTRQGEQFGLEISHLEEAWAAVGYGSSDIVVAVLDTGIRATHEDFESSRLVGGFDYVSNDSSPNDQCGHGTHVAGTVGATTNNGKGVAGMSQASLMNMKVLGPVGGLVTVQCSGSNSDVIAGIIDSADAGADVINMSLGGGGYSDAMNDAVNYAYINHDVLVVAAAGNDGGADNVGYPAALENAIAVGAMDSGNTIASYSDQGPQVEIAAAGSNVLSTTYDNDSSYGTLSGTSMASPHVAGILALARGCAPAGTSAADIRAAMASTAEDKGAPGRDTVFGHGLIRADLLVDAICGGTTPPPTGNTAPVAVVSTLIQDLTATFDASASTDADGDSLTYSWSFGDASNAGNGANVVHHYSKAGTYSVVLTVSDGTTTTTKTFSVTVTAPSSGGDPDPSVPNLTSGESTTVTLSGTGESADYKIAVSAGQDVVVTTSGPGCGLFGCSFDADLFTMENQKASSQTNSCSSATNSNSESCTRNNVQNDGYIYVNVLSYSGSGDITLTATVSN